VAKHWQINQLGFNPVPPAPPASGGILYLIQPDPFVWLYAIDVPSSPRSKFRAAAYPEAVNFERDSLGAVVTYSPASIGHDEVQADTEGSIPRVSLRLQNVTREGIALMEEYGGLIGERVRIVLIRLADTPDGTPVIDETYDVLDSTANEREVVLSLGRVALTARQFPERRCGRTYCIHRYGGPACGYDTTRAGAMQNCTKLEEGTDGCREHGTDEAAAGLENRHPERFGAFRGIPRASGVGVT
jgi:phage-related protein